MTTKTAERKFYTGTIGGTHPKFECALGFSKIGDQDPYFHALAGEWDQREKCFGSCAAHDLLAEKFPEHAHLVKWHLVALHNGPMHYEANALYWAEMAQGKHVRGSYDPDPVEAFKRTVVFGALDTDGGEPWLLDSAALTAWLAIRLPVVMKKFREEIDAAFPGLWAAAEAL